MSQRTAANERQLEGEHQGEKEREREGERESESESERGNAVVFHIWDDFEPGKTSISSSKGERILKQPDRNSTIIP